MFQSSSIEGMVVCKRILIGWFISQSYQTVKATMGTPEGVRTGERYDEPAGRPADRSTHHQNNSETHPAAVHLFVRLGDAIKRILFDHGVHVAQGAELQRVLRVPRCA